MTCGKSVILFGYEQFKALKLASQLTLPSQLFLTDHLASFNALHQFISNKYGRFHTGHNIGSSGLYINLYSTLELASLLTLPLASFKAFYQLISKKYGRFTTGHYNVVSYLHINSNKTLKLDIQLTLPNLPIFNIILFDSFLCTGKIREARSLR